MLNKGYHIQAPTIKASRGGIVKWETLKKQIVTHLKSEPNAYITTLIDYYGLYEKYEFPGWAQANAIVNKSDKLTLLEASMKLDIAEDLRSRFLPYMQLHEFEGLLFNELQIFKDQIPASDLIGVEELVTIFRDYPNPEMINNGRLTAPSKRLSRIILGYNKVVYGDILAEAIGLTRIRSKSPRFNNWIESLETL